MSFQRRSSAACWCLICFAFICAEGDFLLCHHGVILCPAHPGSEHTLDPFYLLLEACLSLSAPLYPSVPVLFSVSKSCDHFSGCIYRDVRQRWCLEAELAPALTVSINHLARDSAPFISPYTLLLVYLPGLFISLFLWKMALFCFSAAHPPACIWRVCVCICVLVVGLSTCVALNLWPQILRRLTAAKYREREWGSTREKRVRFSPPHSALFVCLD